MDLKWLTNQQLSAAHMAWGFCQFPQRQPQNIQGSPVHDIAMNTFLDFPSMLSAEPDTFWNSLLQSSVTSQQPAEWAANTLARLETEAPESAQSQLTAALSALVAAFAEQFPRSQAEAPLRINPLRDQWNTVGPGLCSLVVGAPGSDSPLTDLSCTRIYVVQPVLNGFGQAHLQVPYIRFEGVLTHPCPDIPETLRLAWLIAQFAILCGAEEHATITPALKLAAATATLFAGQELDLCRFDPPTLVQAIELWHMDSLGNSHHKIASASIQWWQESLSGIGQTRIHGLEERLAKICESSE